MKSVNVGGVVRLFQNLKTSDVRRQAGAIELLIRMEQIAIHPRHEEQQELVEIEKNLELDPIEQRWKTQYPYRCDPSVVLQDNYEQAKNFLLRMESRLQKQPETQGKVKQQFEDFIKRGVYSEITNEEDEMYVGP